MKKVVTLATGTNRSITIELFPNERYTSYEVVLSGDVVGSLPIRFCFDAFPMARDKFVELVTEWGTTFAQIS